MYVPGPAWPRLNVPAGKLQLSKKASSSRSSATLPTPSQHSEGGVASSCPWGKGKTFTAMDCGSDSHPLMEAEAM